jgi:ribosome-binding factor A
MANHRIDRINSEIMRELSSLLHEIKDPRLKTADIVTIVKVETTPDLAQSKVHVSVLGSEQSKKDVIKGLASAQSFLRSGIAAALDLHATPKLMFVLDTAGEYASHIEKVIKDIHKED